MSYWAQSENLTKHYLGHFHSFNPRPLRNLWEMSKKLFFTVSDKYFIRRQGSLPTAAQNIKWFVGTIYENYWMERLLALSQVGLSLWQCPHHGANIITTWSPLVIIMMITSWRKMDNDVYDAPIKTWRHCPYNVVYIFWAHFETWLLNDLSLRT